MVAGNDDESNAIITDKSSDTGMHSDQIITLSEVVVTNLSSEVVNILVKTPPHNTVQK